ncbi:MAG: hypothetical protein H7336_05020, partial [Bacteriovorax sp.]|nr:hypothetical protein [Bacteriovorax sp.]
MRKINCHSILLSSLLALGFSSPAHTQQNTDDLFKQVFGKSSREEKKTQVDATLGDFFVGEINVTLVGEKVTKISIADLKRVLTDKIREESLIKYKMGEGDVDPVTLPFKIKYHAAELRVAILIPAEDLRPSDANVYDDLIPYYSRQAIEPAPFSIGLNYKLEQSFNKDTNLDNNFLAQT